ncbi:murein DD-endopeptidase MepM [mine drainage metagenome]|jgi:murein DD-endopeptidase MepM/ murein hydrolase activator NlpD|uniref:Murein DD-endopeptidase MepM n=1 Tax=mine drainage metagenome TaxID=410659 RepID=A0A1J5QWQ4_9ZZZZ
MSLFAATADRLLQRARALREAVERHPGRVAGAVGSALLFTSVTAFGLAEYGPQPKLPPVSVLQQPLALDLGAQLRSLDAQPQLAYTTTEVRRADSAESLLRRLQVTDPAQLRALARDPALQRVLHGAHGVVSAEVDGVGLLHRLQAQLPAHDGADRGAWDELTITAQADGGLSSSVQPMQAQVQTRVASAVVHSTLYAATDAAGIPEPIAAQLADLFAGEVDFRRDLRPGDRISVAWRVYVARGQVLRVGRVIAARVATRGVAHEAVWFDSPQQPGAAGYYAPNGGSLARAFLLSPLPYDRLTSGYGWRISPIFHKPEFHKGIDLAIPVGTPVRTIADGRVVHVGPGTGYGKYVKIEHPGGFATIYSHLSKYEVHVGEQVKQGEVVALSGNTGWSTGPHLYFQFFVHGRPVNPLEIAKYSPKGKSVPAALRGDFVAEADTRSQLLQLLPDVAVASAARD